MVREVHPVAAACPEAALRRSRPEADVVLVRRIRSWCEVAEEASCAVVGGLCLGHRSFLGGRKMGIAQRAPYCSSLTFSIQLTFLPSMDPVTARCVMAVPGAAPCQCFTLGGHHTT